MLDRWILLLANFNHIWVCYPSICFAQFPVFFGYIRPEVESEIQKETGIKAADIC